MALEKLPSNNNPAPFTPATEPLPVILKARIVRKQNQPIRWRLWITTIFTCFIYASPTGFHYVVLNNSKLVVESFIIEQLGKYHQSIFLVSVIWSAITACMAIGCVVGSFMSAYCADRYGRKATLMYFSNFISIAGSACLFLAKPTGAVWLLPTGRFICGIAAGFAQPILGLYLMESCPPELGGFVGSCVDTFLAIMMLITHLLSTPACLGTEELWPYLLSMCSVLAVVGLILSPLFPETPHYLILTKNNLKGGAKAVQFFYDLTKQEDAEALKIANQIGKSEKDSGHMGWGQAWREHFSPLMISTVIGLAAVFCGHIALQSYSTQILIVAGMSIGSAQMETIIMGAYEMAGGLVAPLLNHYAARRSVLLTTLFVCIIGNIAIFFLLQAQTYNPDQILLFGAGAAAMVVVFSAISGPFALRPIIASEVSPQSVRAKSCTLTMAATQTAAILVQWGSWPFYIIYGPYLFLLFASTTFMAWLYIYFRLPETTEKWIVKQPEDGEYKMLVNEFSDLDSDGDL